MEQSLLVLPPACIALYTFRSSLEGEWDFVYEDDFNFNETLELSWDLLRWALGDGVILGVYEPVALLLKSLFVYFFGWTANGFHGLAYALHALCSVLSYHVGLRLLTRLQQGATEDWKTAGAVGCAIGASLFACQPLAVQVVCWLSCLPYIFAALTAQLSVMFLLSMQDCVDKALSTPVSSFAGFCALIASATTYRLLSLLLCVMSFTCKLLCRWPCWRRPSTSCGSVSGRLRR